MHELAVCQALVGELCSIAGQERGSTVTDVFLSIGALAGIEAPLLARAFPLAAAGSVAQHATLHIDSRPVRVRCLACGEETGGNGTRVTCGECGNWRTELISGDEMLLERVVMTREAHV